MRLDKYLSDMGAGTRSELKKEIRKGVASVDGRVVKDPGFSVSPDSNVVFRGAEVAYEEFVYYMLNKPAGIISASEDNREPTVVDLIAEPKRRDLFPVGRLDRDTEGLLIITNDGALSHRLLSPKHHVDKVYYVKAAGRLDESHVSAFKDGLVLPDGLECLPADLEILAVSPDSSEYQDSSASVNSMHLYEQLSGAADCVDTGEAELVAEPEDDRPGINAVDFVTEAKVTIREGKFHQVKRMFSAVGSEVLYLKRLSMGPVSLDPALAPGEYRRLTPEELSALSI